ncbi:MAG: hypothetical protein PHP86_09955 [Nevskiales bacterium]|nr:hypothetical protein [Nevskiales bacterium]
MSESHPAVQRSCPSCGAEMTIAPEQQVEGLRLRCMHCNAEAVVTQEWDEALGQNHWALDDTDDFAEEP